MATKTYRAWLNPDSGTASVDYEIEGSHATFTVRDCNRSVTLDFYDSVRSRRRSKAKIARLIQALELFRSELFPEKKP